jgi:hypothetical protein
MSAEQIQQQLTGMPSGTHSVVSVHRQKPNDAHAFNVIVLNGAVYALDGQSGRVDPWPPKLDNPDSKVTHWYLHLPSVTTTPTHSAITYGKPGTTNPGASDHLVPDAHASNDEAGQSDTQGRPAVGDQSDFVGSSHHRPFGEALRRVIGPRGRGHEALVRSLTQEARQVQQARVQSGRQALGEDRFGPDPFGLRDLAPTPPQLQDVRLADVPTDQLDGHFDALDLAKAPGDTGGGPSTPAEIWSEPSDTPPDWWWPGERPEDAVPLPPLPQQLEMPKVFHSIWLGGPVTDGRPATDELRANLEVLSAEAQEQGMRVILWTDVPRSHLGQTTGDAADMRAWAQQHRFTLLSPDEVFHVNEPMSLAAEFKLETAKGSAIGYTAASDIVRMEILHRFGGIYTDHDNEVHSLEGLRNLLQAPGFAVHGVVGGSVSNSAVLAARGHPLIGSLLKKIAANYELHQDQLDPTVHDVGNSRQEHQDHYFGARRLRRRSIIERSGPVVSTAVALGLSDEQIPRIAGDQLEQGDAKTWLSTNPRRSPPEQTVTVLQHAVSGLIRDLGNRRGDLNLAAVAPLIRGLSDPATGWEALVGYIHSDPQLRMQVQTVTHSFLEFEDETSLFSHVRLRELDLPPTVLEMFGLPPQVHAQDVDVPGVWRRGAFGAQVQSGNWSHVAVDFQYQQHGLDSPTPEMHALVDHLHNLAATSDWQKIEVWVEGGGNNSESSAARHRGEAVHQHLTRMAGDVPKITWHDPTPRGAGKTQGPAPIDNKRQVIVWWTATPTPPPVDEPVIEMSFAAAGLGDDSDDDGGGPTFGAPRRGPAMGGVTDPTGAAGVSFWESPAPPPSADPPGSSDTQGVSGAQPPADASATGGIAAHSIADQGQSSQPPNHPRPSAQLDPTLDSDRLNLITLAYPPTNSAGAVFIRHDDDLLYRYDTRGPDEIFEQGFAPRDSATRFTPIDAFVSTTRDPLLYFGGPSTPGRPIFRYTVDAPGGVDVNRTSGAGKTDAIDIFEHQQEIAFLGGVRRENIVGVVQVLPEAVMPGGDEGVHERPTPEFGLYQNNPNFNPNLLNPVPPPTLGAIGSWSRPASPLSEMNFGAVEDFDDLNSSHVDDSDLDDVLLPATESAARNSDMEPAGSSGAAQYSSVLGASGRPAPPPDSDAPFAVAAGDMDSSSPVQDPVPSASVERDGLNDFVGSGGPSVSPESTSGGLEPDSATQSVPAGPQGSAMDSALRTSRSSSPEGESGGPGLLSKPTAAMGSEDRDRPSWSLGEDDDDAGADRSLFRGEGGHNEPPALSGPAAGVEQIDSSSPQHFVASSGPIQS